ncbi:MAG: hypothetical protein COU11_03905, partial [Candidatus Harrisonbacteria bacterium CG10_big_fil_rev_8_21_14_0_10_49_15]
TLDVTGTGRFTQPILVGTPTADGHATTKSYVDSAFIDAAGDTATGPILFPDGSAAAPAVSFSADTNTGIYRLGDDNVGLTTGGTRRIYVNSGGLYLDSGHLNIISGGVIKNGDGTAANPTYTFTSDTNTGIYRIGADNLGITAGGDLILGVENLDSTDFRVTLTEGASGNVNRGLWLENTGGGAQASVLRFYRPSGSPAANDSIGAISFTGKDGATNDQDYANILAQVVDPTSTSEEGKLTLRVTTGGSTTNMVTIVGTGVGIGTTDIENWATYKAIEMPNSSIMFRDGGIDTHYSSNAYYDGAWKYKTTDEATRYAQETTGEHAFFVAPSGTIDTAITWTRAMEIDNTGNVGIGTTAPAGSLHVSSAGGSSNPQLKLTQTSNTDWNRLVMDANGNIFTLSVGAPGSSIPNVFNIHSSTSGSNVLSVASTGRVGIGQPSPSYTLDVTGTGRFTQPVLVGTPTADGHATTKSYV